MIRPTPRRRCTHPIAYENFDYDSFMASIRARTKPVKEIQHGQWTYPIAELKWKAPPVDDVHPSIQRLYTEYYNKQKIPPIEERVQAFRAAGYPEHVLEDMVTKHLKRMDSKSEDEQFIKNIFGEVSNKKEAPPKKKTLSQLLNIKKPRVVAIDPRYEVDEDL